MRLIYITQTAPFGRGESFVIPEIEQLLARGHEVQILPLGNGEVFHNRAQTLIDRTRVISLTSPVVLLSIAWAVLQKPVRTARAVWLLRRSNSFKQFVLNGIALLKGIHAARVASVWRADHVHAHWANFTATLGMTVGILSDIPWSFTAHRYDIVAGNLLTEKLQRASFSRFIAHNGLALASSRANLAVMKKGLVLHMGVLLPQESQMPAGPTSAALFLCPAALIPIKGHKYLIDAVALLRRRGVQCELWLIGDGPLHDELCRQIELVEVAGSVRMVGALPHEEVLSLYRTHRPAGVVLPSVDLGEGLAEGIPVSLMEAMSFGVPVVSTRTGGIPELLQDGGGMLVPPQDAAALADAMQQLIEDAELRERLGQSGRQRVEQSFNVRIVAGQLVSMFQASCRSNCMVPSMTAADRTHEEHTI